ncbi:MAG TPA: hypothetical protein VGM27_01180 [Acidobacteriaceae bacterium]
MIIHLLEGFAVVSTIVIVSLSAAILLAALLRSASAPSQVTKEQNEPCNHAAILAKGKRMKAIGSV